MALLTVAFASASLDAQGKLALSSGMGTLALVGVVVQDDEVAHLLQFRAADRVVAVDEALAYSFGREHLDQPHDGGDAQMDAGGFQRLDEAAGQAGRDDVLVPGLEPAAGAEAQQHRLLDRFRADVPPQVGDRFIIRHDRTRKNAKYRP